MKKTLMIISLLITLMMLSIPCTNAIQAQIVKKQTEEKTNINLLSTLKTKLTKITDTINKLGKNTNLDLKTKNNILQGLKRIIVGLVLITIGLLIIVPSLFMSTVGTPFTLIEALRYAIEEKITGSDVPFPIILTPIFYWLLKLIIPYAYIKGGFLIIIKGSFDEKDLPIYFSLGDYVDKVIPPNDDNETEPNWLLLYLLSLLIT